MSDLAPQGEAEDPGVTPGAEGAAAPAADTDTRTGNEPSDLNARLAAEAGDDPAAAPLDASAGVKDESPEAPETVNGSALSGLAAGVVAGSQLRDEQQSSEPGDANLDLPWPEQVRPLSPRVGESDWSESTGAGAREHDLELVPAFAAALEDAAEGPVSAWLGRGLFFLAMIAAFALRLVHLDAKPLHHDEGVNAYFLLRLLEEGVYHYDPTNYHGPFLYYAGYLPLLAAKSPGPWSLRLFPALFSAVLILFTLPLRRSLGWIGIATAAWILALSPSMNYVGRTAIHESYFVGFVLLALVSLLAYLRDRRRWLPGVLLTALALIYANKETGVISYGALGVGAFAALFFAKTPRFSPWPLQRARAAYKTLRATWGRPPSYLASHSSFAVPLTGFLLLTGLLFWAGGGLRVLLWWDKAGNSWQVAQAFALDRMPKPGVYVIYLLGIALLVWSLWGLVPAARDWWRSQPLSRRPWVAGFLVSAAVMVALFSSLFTSPRGLFGLTTSLVHWVARGVAAEKTGHEKPFPYYLELLIRFESPVMLLSVLGAFCAIARRRVVGLFLLGWASSTFTVYSVLAYKTPWLVINLVLPLALLAAYGIGSVSALGSRIKLGSTTLGRVVPPLFGLALLSLPWAPNPAPNLDQPKVEDPAKRKTFRWGMQRAKRWLSVESRPWYELTWDLNVTRPDDDRYHLVYGQTDRDALRLFRRLDVLLEGEAETVSILTPEYWPLPTYLHPHRAGYHEEGLPKVLDKDLYVASQQQSWDLYDLARADGWTREHYTLRTGVTLVLLIRPGITVPPLEERALAPSDPKAGRPR